MSTEDTPDKTDEPAHPYETDDSFHPLGKEWEDQMRDELEGTDFDADLGMQMARDAQRLVAGEITEDEFYAQYHDDVEDEFEVDARPVFDDVEGSEFDDIDDNTSMLEALRDIDLEADESSRRDVMKKMGAGAAFLGYGAFASYDNGDEEDIPQDISGVFPADEDERDHRWGMVIDLERCDGCLACVTGCIDENATSTGANWMYVFAYENEDTDQDNFLVRPCQHCSNAPCAKVCPVRARHTRSKDGLVLTDYETCIGCRYCQVACPYGVNYFQWGEPDVPIEEIEQVDYSPSEIQALDDEERADVLEGSGDHVYDERGRWVDSRPPQGVMGKCTMCPSRQDEHTPEHGPKGTVACMDACDSQGMSAIHFGDLDDPNSRPNQYLQRRSDKAFEERNIRFEGDVEFELTLDTVDDGLYPLHFVERRVRDEGIDPARLVASDSVVVSSATPSTESEDFEPSYLEPIGGVPTDSPGVLYTDEEDVAVDAMLSFDDDEFDDEAAERAVDIRLRLNDQVVSEQSITLDATDDYDEDVDRIQRAITFSVDGTAVDAPSEQVSVLFFEVEETVEEDEEEMDVWQFADTQPVFVSETRPAIDKPEIEYDNSPLGGSLDTPPVLFRDVEPEDQRISGEIGYPDSVSDYQLDLVVLEPDGTDVSIVEQVYRLVDGEEELEDNVYDFAERWTTNTAWNGKQSSFRLLEDLGTDPNITYLGDEPGPNDEQVDGPVTYEMISDDSIWSEWQETKDNRKEHLDYGAGAGERVRG